MAKKKEEKISHAEIDKAIKRFQKQGGLIHKLPEQIVCPEWIILPKENYNSVPDYETGYEK
jgi:hypothetical protein